MPVPVTISMRRRRTGAPEAMATATAHPECARRPKTASFDGMVGLEVSGEEAPDLHARFLGGLGVDAIKVMPARGVVVDLVVELLAFGFQSFDQVLYLEDVDILVVGVGVDEERRGEFLGVEDGRSAAILH